MSTVWILLIFFKYGYAGGAAAPELSSKGACETAGQSTVAKWNAENWGNMIFYSCVAKD